MFVSVVLICVDVGVVSVLVGGGVLLLFGGVVDVVGEFYCGDLVDVIDFFGCMVVCGFI